MINRSAEICGSRLSQATHNDIAASPWQEVVVRKMVHRGSCGYIRCANQKWEVDQGMSSSTINVDNATSREIVWRLIRETIPSRWRLYALALVCVLGVAAFTAALAYSTKLIVNEVFVADDTSAAWKVALIVVGVSAGKSLFQYGNSVISFMFNRAVATAYQKQLFKSLLGMDVTHFSGKQASAQMAQVNLYGQASAKIVVGVSIRMLTELVTLIGLAAVMLTQDLLMSAGAALLFPMIFSMIGYLSRRIRAVAQSESELTGAYFAIGAEAFAGIKTVKSYSLEEKSIGRFEEAVEKLQRRMLGIARITSATVPLMEFLGGLVIGAFVVYAAWQTIEYGKTPGEYTAFLTAFLMAYQPAERLSKEWVEIQKAIIHAGRMINLLDTPRRVPLAGGLSLDDVTASICFKNVSFSYSHQPALKDVSFSISPGERVAIVGRSGAGKTTLIDLVQGFYLPKSGVISIGSRDIAEINPEALRQSIALISQEVFLFEGTIRENIRDGNPEATEVEIYEAARRAQVTSFSDQTKKGLDSPVGPNGSFLSGGQRQRVGIARALAKRAKIYIFDEATSALDGITEKALMEEIFNSADPDSIFLFVTHRASTLGYVDRVLLLEKGQVIAFGSHADMTIQNAKYRTLFSLAIESNGATPKEPHETLSPDQDCM